jgi:hypothetical protein
MKMKLRKVSEYQSHILWLDKGYGFRVTIRGEMLSEPLTAEDVARDFPFLDIPDDILFEVVEHTELEE